MCMCLFLAVPWFGLQFVIVVVPGHPSENKNKIVEPRENAGTVF